MGRPLRLTAKRRKKICQGIQLGMTYKLAAQFGGVSESTLHAWLRRGRKCEGRPFMQLLESVKEAEAAHAAIALGSIVKASRDSWQAGAWLLERRHGFNKTGQAGAQRDEDELGGLTDPNESVRLRFQLAELRVANRLALDSGSLQAYMAGKRLERTLVADLALALGGDGHDPVEDLESPVFRGQLLEAMGEWPDTLLEDAIGVYEQRHSITLLSGTEDGKS